jgi:ABC-2 type transport system permease protein
MNSMLTMARALVYLRAMSFAGLMKSRLARLKQPKYLAGAIVGAAYVYLVFLRPRTHGPSRAGVGVGNPRVPFPTEALPLIVDVASLVVLIMLLVNWAIPRRASLSFSETEIAFLFPAPVNRRMLVHYRLLSSQIGILFSALILTVVFRRGQMIGGNFWFHTLGWWLILATLDLHSVGAMFTYSKLLNPSITTALRKRITLALGLVVAGALVVWIWIDTRGPQQGDLDGPRAIGEYIASQLHAGPVPWLLAIPKAMIAPYFAGDLRQFVLALGPALLVLFAHYFWVVHIEVAFEEASIARAEKRARLRARRTDWRGPAAVRKAQPAPFDLTRVRRPELAFLWKNLLSTNALFRPKPVLFLVLFILVSTQWLARNPHFEVTRTATGMICAVLIVMTMLLGPIMTRIDLRADLRNSDMLKTYPLHGWQIVFGELLTPIAILSVLVWLFLLASYLLLPTESLRWLAPSLRGLAALGIAVLAPAFVAIQLLVLNAATLVFPAWAQSVGNPAERGIDVLGQRIIFMASQLLVTIVTTLPALILAALILFIGQWLLGFTVGAVLAIAGMGLLLAWEAWLGIRWLGTQFDRFDLATELRP